MKTSIASQTELDLVFGWDEPRRQGGAIAGFLVGSILLHAVCFYLFQVVYPPAIALLPPPGRVTVISPNTPEGRLLLGWLEAEDPALASTTQPIERGTVSLPIVQHAPSYLMHQPALKEGPQLTPDDITLSAHPPGRVETHRAPLRAATRISPTVVRFSAELQATNLPQLPGMDFKASGRETPRASQFRVAASEQGDIRYCFLETPSGDAMLDEQAREYLMLFRLPGIRSSSAAAEGDLVWGTAIVEWGNDIATPHVKATETSAP